MDEESGVKTPAAVVTRLRRRLSTEAEGAQSPVTPSTPNKKRSTRLAKPALELIDENVTESVPKKVTRRASAKDAEPVGETPITPSRRSSRIRSNTSLLMEATQNIVPDSPRAKRALRRNSQIGSDTEAATTPARRARTRKDSTSSVEKLGTTTSIEKTTVQIAEPITEEPEKEITKDKLNNGQNITPLRKSPRLNKSSKNSTDKLEHNIDKNENSKQNYDDFTNTPKLTDHSITKDSVSSLNELKAMDNNVVNLELKYSETPNISIDSANLIHNISSPKKSTDFNKTVSAIEELNNDKIHLKRTKSWTTLTTNETPTETNSNKFASGDSIIEKNDIKSPKKSINKSISTYNTSIESKENIVLKSPQDLNASDTIRILERTPIKDIRPVLVMEDSDSDSGNEKLPTGYNESVNNDGGDQCVPVIKQATPERLTSENFDVEPMDIDETIPEKITINDISSKSNSGKDETEMADLTQNSPQYKHSSCEITENPNKSTRTSINLQPESSNSTRKSKSPEMNNNINDAIDGLSSEKSQRKSSISFVYANDNVIDKSNRKSSISKAESDNDKRKSSVSSLTEGKLNESSNISKRKSVSETQHFKNLSDINKSTLVLSQVKDASESGTQVNSPKDFKHDLSKSVNIPYKESEKLDQSNYLTSTPLHQKPLQKLAMQINTSVISPTVESKKTSKGNKTDTSVKETSNDCSDSDHSEEFDKHSTKQNNIIDAEAEEASDDYESGDSRNEEEIQYEKDHEITEKGETLQSESDVSNDTDYEKDSFVVSSDQEDNVLLSGSADDLSLTDNELKMTAKSKKKFDERKRKEQKEASREMYEARHQLNESKQKFKSKRKTKKVESSSSESEEETEPKNKNHAKTDSSQDIALNKSEADESITVKKKKVKRLSESIYEDNPNEKEITIHNHSLLENNDPLEVDIKEEPKTPQKEFNMSTVIINNNIEQIQVETNTTVMNSDETSDPLQATMIHEDDSDSDVSKDIEIQENYESVLASLNKANGKKSKVKTHDLSLNFNKEAKNKIKEPIIDKLNLTQTKSKKKKSQHFKDTTEKSSNIVQDDETDSIDMRLLFPEDSNDSEGNNTTKKPDKNEELSEEFIPLKKTKAKTDLRKNIDEPEESLGFFIDTKGDHDEVEATAQNSAKKNKKRKRNASLNYTDDYNDTTAQETLLSSSSPQNVSISSDKKKKKNKSQHDVSQIVESAAHEETAISEEKKKKKEKLHLDIAQTVEDTAPEKAQINVSTETKKKKKKNKSHFDSSDIIVDADVNPVVNLLEISSRYEQSNSDGVLQNDSLNSDKNKKKKKNNSQQDISQNVNDTAQEESPQNVSISSDKKKKKNKSQLDVSQIVESAAHEDTAVNVSSSIEKKNKKEKSHVDISQIVEDTAPEETPINVSAESKKKKKKNKSHLNSSEIIVDAASQEMPPINTSIDIKNKKNKSLSNNVANTGEESDEAPMEVAYKSDKKSDYPESVDDNDTTIKIKNKFKKKKNKNKHTQPETGINPEKVEVKAKKRKHDHSFNTTAVFDDETLMSKSQKKKKLSQHDEGASTSKSSKREAREDDYIQRNSKVFKANFSQNIHVPRLPESIVNQLEDQPAPEQLLSKKPKKKKPMAIATMPFIVEEEPSIKNKPSNYLEQSICLNDSISPIKQKKKIKHPKVLPFTPTVITSEEGYTSRFKINVIPQETHFIAQANNMTNFRDEYLSKQRRKKLRVEQFKRQRNHKLVKF